MYIAIDIGSNNVRVASSNSITKPKLKTIKFKTVENYETDLDNIINAIQQLKQNKKIKDIRNILQKRQKVTPAPALKLSKHKDDIALYGALGLFRDVLI